MGWLAAIFIFMLFMYDRVNSNNEMIEELLSTQKETNRILTKILEK